MKQTKLSNGTIITSFTNEERKDMKARGFKFPNKEIQSKKCCLCNKKFYGYGNNAQPLKNGICCDDCNLYKVVPARVLKMSNNIITFERKTRHPISDDDLTWSEAKKKYPKLNPFKDNDKDSKPNIMDCRPLNKKKQDSWLPESFYKDLYVKPSVYKAFGIIKYGREMGLDTRETHNLLKEKGFSSDEMKQGLDAYNESRTGKEIGVY